MMFLGATLDKKKLGYSAKTTLRANGAVEPLFARRRFYIDLLTRKLEIRMKSLGEE